MNLIEKARNGDKDAFSELYSVSRKNLYKYCRILCGDDAGDLMQQTYLKAWEKIHELRSENFSAWLRSIARSIFLNNLRKNKPQDFIEELPEIPDSEDNNPVYIAENREISKILMNKINNCLNPLQRLAVVLYYYDEKSVSEIADIMQCSVGTVESRLYYARKKLRQALKNDIFSFGWFAVLSMKRRLKNIKISVNARITASAVLTVTAMTAVSMTNLNNTENKLPKEVIILESTSDTTAESTETASIKPTSHTTTKPVSYTTPTSESLTTAFKSDSEEIAPKEDDTEPEEEQTENHEPQTETEEETTMKKEIITVATAATMALTGTTMTTTATTTTAEIPTVTTVNGLEIISYGDANGDDNVSISDSVAIMQSITNEEKYPLDDNAKVNADVYNPGDGVTGMDARSIMRLDAGIIDSLPEYPEIEEIPVTTTFPEEEYYGTTTTTAVFNPDSPKRTQGPDFEAGNFSIDRDTTKWYDKGRSEYMAEFQHAEFEKYFNKYFKEQENLISDTALKEQILSVLPVNFFPYMKTELLKITSHESSTYGTVYTTEEKLPDLLRISAIKNDARWIDQLLLDECAEIVHNEFSDYVTGTYKYAFHPGVEKYEGIMKYDSLFPFPDYCYRYYFIGDDNEENTRIAEEIITRLRQVMTEKYGDCVIIDGDIWLDCYGVNTNIPWGLDDDAVYYPSKHGYYDGHLIEAFTSIKNIYFSPEGENITYWDISNQENEIIS